MRSFSAYLPPKNASSNYSLALWIEHNLDLAAEELSAQVSLEVSLDGTVVAVELGDFTVHNLLRLWIHDGDALAEIVLRGVSVKNVVDGEDGRLVVSDSHALLVSDESTLNE